MVSVEVTVGSAWAESVTIAKPASNEKRAKHERTPGWPRDVNEPGDVYRSLNRCRGADGFSLESHEIEIIRLDSAITTNSAVISTSNPKKPSLPRPWPWHAPFESSR